MTPFDSLFQWVPNFASRPEIFAGGFLRSRLGYG